MMPLTMKVARGAAEMFHGHCRNNNSLTPSGFTRRYGLMDDRAPPTRTRIPGLPAAPAPLGLRRGRRNSAATSGVHRRTAAGVVFICMLLELSRSS